MNEGIDAYALLPAVGGGTCDEGLQPIWRLFRGNDRFPDAPNHRFVARRDLYLEFLAGGWDGEDVRLCVPGP